MEKAAEQVRESVEDVYRLESRRILATLIRLLSDFDLARQDPERRFLERRLAGLG